MRLLRSDAWRRWGWLGLSGLAVLAAGWWFHAHGRSIAGDRLILAAMLAALGLAAAMQVAATRAWNCVALGLFWLMVGVFAFLGAFAPALYVGERAPAWVQAAYRACFVVAAPLLLVGLARLAWARRRGDGGGEGEDP